MESVVDVGQACRHCKTPVVKKVPKKRSPKKAYWYEWYLYCPGCCRMYMVEATKILNPAYKAPAWKADWEKNKAAKAELDGGFLRAIGGLEKIIHAPSGSPASKLRRLAREALDGVDLVDTTRKKEERHDFQA